jgi:hypothetical protein
MNRKPMQVTIEAIVQNAGRMEEFEKAIEGCQSFHLSVERKGYMRLVIEVTPMGEVSVAHYYTQNGDAMRDPEIVFLPDCWLPVEITQDPVGIYQRANPGRYLKGANQLANVWAMNLRHQGFTE